jgi:hypothetical protein
MNQQRCFVLRPFVHLFTSVKTIPAQDLPWQRLTRNWSGDLVQSTAKFRLSSDGEILRWEVQSSEAPPDSALGEAPGRFLEGLWTRDVAELFVAGEGDAYTEWNLSPYGAWWAQGFTASRVRDRAFTIPEGVQIWAELRGDTGWRAGMELYLPPGLTLEQLRLNATMIIRNGRTEGNAPDYLATVRMPGIAPDFHMVKRYPKPLFKKI